MTPNEYQHLAARTLIDGPDFELEEKEVGLVVHAVDAARMLGELADYLKKGIFHRHGVDFFRVYDDYSKTQVALGQLLAPIKMSLTDPEVMLLWNTLGLLGESGEIAKLAYESILQGYTDREKLKKELGDCLWYLAALCTKADLALEDVMHANIEKLKLRYPDGYSAEASRKRVDVVNEEEGAHTCATCGRALEAVRPGKWQCAQCG